MASKRYNPTKGRHKHLPTDEEHTRRGCFMADLLDGTIVATTMTESRVGGRLRIDYEDPNG